MPETYTSKFMEKIRNNNTQAAYVSKHIPIDTYHDEKQNNEAKIRRKIQSRIRELLKYEYTEEKIEKQLKEEGYSNYCTFFNNWIIGAILKDDIKLRNYIKRQIELDIELDTIKEYLLQKPIYLKYKRIFDNYLEDCKERRLIEKRKEQDRQIKKSQSDTIEER